MARNIPKLLLIDLDGVLTNSFHIHLKGWEKVCSIINGKFPYEKINDFYGLPATTAIKDIINYNKLDILEEEISSLVKIKDDLRDIEISKLSNKDVTPCAENFLADSYDKGVINVCVATTRACNNILTRLELDKYFHKTVCGQYQHPPKNHSASSLINIINEFNLMKIEALFIDDGILPSVKSFQAGIPTCLFNNKSNNVQNFIFQIKDFNEKIDFYYKKALHALFIDNARKLAQ